MDYSTVYYKGNWIRIDSKNKTTISNSATHKTYEIDHRTKTFIEDDSDITSQASEGMQQLKPKITATVNPTDEHKTILDRQATKYLGEMKMEMSPPQLAGKSVHMTGHIECWTVSDIGAGDNATSFLGGTSDISGVLMSLTGMAGAKSELQKIKGFAVATNMTMTLDSEEMPAGSVSLELDYTVLSLSQATLSPALFRVPADYKRAPGDAEAEPWKVIRR